MITTKEDFIREYRKICAMGWISSHRKGSTGIGKTLEDLLGIAENNLMAPDFGRYELKATRENSGSMLTMMTLSPLPTGVNSYLREKYGYVSDVYDNPAKVLHTTLSATQFTSIADTGHKLKLMCDREKICIVSETEVENAYWTRERLQKAFEKKYKGTFIYAKALAREGTDGEEFSFTEAYEVSDFDYTAMVRLLEMGKIYVDIRIGQYPNGRTHDHGTAFRIRESDQPLLFRISHRIV